MSIVREFLARIWNKHARDADIPGGIIGQCAARGGGEDIHEFWILGHFVVNTQAVGTIPYKAFGQTFHRRRPFNGHRRLLRRYFNSAGRVSGAT